MRLPLPGPGDLVDTVRDVTAAAAALGRLATRAGAMVPHLEQTLSRVGDLLDRAEAAVARIEQLTGDADTAVRSAVPLLDELAVLVERVGPVVAGAEQSVQRVDAVVGQAESSVHRVDAERIAETVEPHEVDAAVLLVDRLPELLRAVDDDLLPLARQPNGVGPELHSLLELVEDPHAMVARLPGMKLIGRREPSE